MPYCFCTWKHFIQIKPDPSRHFEVLSHHLAHQQRSCMISICLQHASRGSFLAFNPIPLPKRYFFIFYVHPFTSPFNSLINRHKTGEALPFKPLHHYVRIPQCHSDFYQSPPLKQPGLPSLKLGLFSKKLALLF